MVDSKTRRERSPKGIVGRKHRCVKNNDKEHDQQAKSKATPKNSFMTIMEKKGPFLWKESKKLVSKQDIIPSKEARKVGEQGKSKAKTKDERTMSRGRRSEYKGISSDFDCGEESEDTCEDLSTPYKRPKPTPFTMMTSRFKYHRRAKLLRNIKMYESNKDPKDHLGIFLATTEQDE
ncbi:hypothetical protein Tco_1224394 [Tanacetum coccineum]